MVFEVALNFIWKIISFKKGTLSLLSFSLSMPLTFWFETLTNGTDLKHLLIPIVLMVVGTIMFCIVCLADLITGLKAAKHKSLIKFKDPKKPYIKSYKLYRTLWKLLGVSLLSFLLAVTSIMIEIMGLTWVYIISISLQGTVWLLSCGFEIHSIGENHEKRYGYKPRIFKFWDNILNLFEKKITNKIDSSFDNIFEEDEEEKSI